MKNIYSRFEQMVSARSYLGLLFLRLFVGARLLYGVIDNILSWEQMIEFATFLESFAFPLPVISAVVSVYLQFLGSIAILVGFKIRIASLFIAVNFAVALLMVHFPAGDTFEAMTPALAMLFGAVTFLFLGAGRLAVEKE